jgi:hypothetical protein
MKTKILAGLLLGASALAAAPRFSIGIGVGVPVRGYYAPAPVYLAPAPVYGYGPAYVAPSYGFTAGYWEGYGPHRVWRPGYRVEPRGGFRYRR